MSGHTPALCPAGLAVALVAWNTVANRTRWFHRWYVPANLAVTASLLAAARIPPAALGLDRHHVRNGLRAGGVVAAVLAGAFAAALASPRSRRWLRDGRVRGLSAGQVAWWAGVRVPLGTVILEEVAFRGVLLAAWRARGSTTAAVVASSLAFGLWHVSPTLAALTANGVTQPRARAAGVAAAVAATTLGGAGLCCLRLRSGSLAAPAITHAAANSLALLAAYRAQCRSQPPMTVASRPPPPRL